MDCSRMRHTDDDVWLKKNDGLVCGGSVLRGECRIVKGLASLMNSASGTAQSIVNIMESGW